MENIAATAFACLAAESSVKLVCCAVAVIIMTLSGIICSLFELNCPYGVSKSAFLCFSLSHSVCACACMRMCDVRLRAHTLNGIPYNANALSSA